MAEPLRYGNKLPTIQTLGLTIIFARYMVTKEIASQTSRNFREYKVWKDAVDFSVIVYSVTSQLPYFEKKGLCDQLQRAAVSISSNIAEGAARSKDLDFAHFLDFALGSAYEVETQLIIANKVGYLDETQFTSMISDLQSIEKQLSAFVHKIRNSK